MKLSDGWDMREVIKTENWEDAQFWIPDVTDINSSVTIGKPYRIFYDKACLEDVIFDDENRNSTVYLWIPGQLYKFQ